MGLGLAQRRFPDLLVELGQLPAEGDAPLRAEGGGQVVQRGAQLVGRFVEDDRPLFALQLGQPLPLLLFVYRQKTLEHPAGGVLTGDGQRRHTGGGCRNGHHLDAPGQCVPHDHFARVRDAGHTGIAAQGAVLACLNAAQDPLALLQGVLVVAHHRLFQPQKVEQLHGHAGILRGNEICRAKGGCHTGRHVIQVADGCGNDIKSTCHSILPFDLYKTSPLSLRDAASPARSRSPYLARSA